MKESHGQVQGEVCGFSATAFEQRRQPTRDREKAEGTSGV
jgi:hypothetical protein